MDLYVEFLWYEDCPSHGDGLRLLQGVLTELGVTAEIEQIKVETEDQAHRLQFPGSPTIRINGGDIDPHGAETLAYGLTCRAYRREDGRISPLPSGDQVRQAVQRAVAEGPGET